MYLSRLVTEPPHVLQNVRPQHFPRQLLGPPVDGIGVVGVQPVEQLGGRELPPKQARTHALTQIENPIHGECPSMGQQSRPFLDSPHTPQCIGNLH
jgi:hypothetical protein